MNKLKIGLTMRVVEATEYAETKDALSHDWPVFMHSVLPEAKWMALPNLGKDVTKYLDGWQLNGFIITGGNNISEYSVRDKTELALIQYALDNNLPLLGVCRGFQIMAHYFGYEIKSCKGHAGTRHQVNINGDTYTVNSYHNNCGPVEIKQPLVAFARDIYGHIEGFYHQDKPLIAIMWHPERELPATDFDVKMIRNLFL